MAYPDEPWQESQACWPERDLVVTDIPFYDAQLLRGYGVLVDVLLRGPRDPAGERSQRYVTYRQTALDTYTLIGESPDFVGVAITAGEELPELQLLRLENARISSSDTP
jgi:hypothetical protein